VQSLRDEENESLQSVQSLRHEKDESLQSLRDEEDEALEALRMIPEAGISRPLFILLSLVRYAWVLRLS
jgi:hypothetical protein